MCFAMLHRRCSGLVRAGNRRAHAIGLPLGPGMFDLGQAVLDDMQSLSWAVCTCGFTLELRQSRDGMALATLTQSNQSGVPRMALQPLSASALSAFAGLAMKRRVSETTDHS